MEGMKPDVILDALRRAGATFEEEEIRETSPSITKADLVDLGLSGCQGSGERRLALIRKLEFPEHMSANALLQALNLLYSLDELKRLLHEDFL